MRVFYSLVVRGGNVVTCYALCALRWGIVLSFTLPTSQKSVFGYAVVS